MTVTMQMGMKKKSGEGWSWEAKKMTVHYKVESWLLLHPLRKNENEVAELSVGCSCRPIVHLEYLSAKEKEEWPAYHIRLP